MMRVFGPSCTMGGASTLSVTYLFTGEEAREMITEFNTPPKTPLEDPPMDLILPAELTPPAN